MASDATGAKSIPAGIRYLAFQGGGGKGVAYVGAIKALQRLINGPAGQDLRLVRPWTKKNQIKGVSGASAGAITALFICMGYSANDLGNLLANEMDFSSFFDGPVLGKRCYVTTDNNGAILIQFKSDGKTSTKVLNLVDPISSPSTSNLVAQVLFPNDPSLALLKKTLTSGDVEQWLGCLLLDFGLCLGRNAVNFFGDRIQQFMDLQPFTLPYTGLTLPFKEFVKLTNGVRLVVSGTNISQNRTFYFSDQHTPDFPVAAACFISMCLPTIFKSVWVDAMVDSKDKPKSSAYRGLWIDGGVLNNFPLHAFDHTPAKKSQDPDLFELEPGMLGFQIVDGFDPSNKVESNIEPPKPSDMTIADFFSSLLGTLLYPSGEGQIRSPHEAEQTIKIFAGKLTTLDFSPSPADAADAQQNAYDSVMRFYGDYG